MKSSPIARVKFTLTFEEVKFLNFVASYKGRGLMKSQTRDIGLAIEYGEKCLEKVDWLLMENGTLDGKISHERHEDLPTWNFEVQLFGNEYGNVYDVKKLDFLNYCRTDPRHQEQFFKEQNWSLSVVGKPGDSTFKLGYDQNGLFVKEVRNEWNSKHPPDETPPPTELERTEPDGPPPRERTHTDRIVITAGMSASQRVAAGDPDPHGVT